MATLTFDTLKAQILANARQIEGSSEYLVTDTGRVFSLKRNKFLTNYVGGKEGNEYLNVTIRYPNKQSTMKVHRLVAIAFIPNPLNLREVNHKDGNRFNNRVSNLEWCTSAENINHAYRTGLRRTGENNSRSKLTNQQAEEIRELYKQGGYTWRKLAAAHNVSSVQIGKVLKGKTYKNYSQWQAQ